MVNTSTIRKGGLIVNTSQNAHLVDAFDDFVAASVEALDANDDRS